MKFRSLNCAFGFALLIISAGAKAKTTFEHPAPLLVTQATRADSLTPPSSALADEEPLPQDPTERAARLVKNLRYNGGRGDLTKSDELFSEQYEPRSLPLVPLEESAIACKGQVIKMQAFLSADRSHIYTEITLRVDEIFKQDKDFKLSSGQTLMVTQIGGAIKLAFWPGNT